MKSEGEKPKKATNAVIAGRVEEILRLRIDGAMFHDIRDYADHPDRNWQLSDSQLKRYIQRSDELLRQRIEKSRGRSTRLHLARREALYARALQAADFRTALAVLQDLAKLRDLYPKDSAPPGAGEKAPAIIVEGEAAPQ